MIVNTEIGSLGVDFDAFGNVCALHFTSCRPLCLEQKNNKGTSAKSRREKTVTVELEEYFAGKRRDFTIPFAVAGSSFSLCVWNALCHISYGERVSYSDIAMRINAPRATRAVAHAVATNPIPIIVPCHRVVRKNGQLGEYALHTLGKRGRAVKEYLLNLESV